MDGVNFHHVLITGGGSFIGYHIVSKILQTEPKYKISVLDLPTSLPRFSTVHYYDVDISDKASVLTAIQEI
jgi:sterol-4alpha-carboxylate 3-dehydrogenase (decarboxylating)